MSVRNPILLRACTLAFLASVAGSLHAAEPSPGGEPARRPLEPYQRDNAYRWVDPDAPVVTRPAAPPIVDDRPFAAPVEHAARAAGVDPDLVHALIDVESAYRPDAISPKGAVGLMQLMPDTALRYGVKDPRKVENNLSAGTRHLRDLMQTFGDRLDLVLAAYNAGEGAVRRHGNRIPPYAETRQYVPAVMKRYQARSKPPPSPAPLSKTTRHATEYLPGTRLDPRALETLP